MINLSSVQFSRSVVSDSLWPHESQHARPPCPSPSPGVHSDSCPSSRWCHPAISSSVVPFSSCPQSLPASESFPMSHLFAWRGQSTGASALASFLPKKSQGWSPSEWTGWRVNHIFFQNWREDKTNFSWIIEDFQREKARIYSEKWHGSQTLQQPPNELPLVPSCHIILGLVYVPNVMAEMMAHCLWNLIIKDHGPGERKPNLRGSLYLFYIKGKSGHVVER